MRTYQFGILERFTQCLSSDFHVVAIFDLWRVTPSIRALMLAGESLDKISAAIVANGYISLFETGLQMALSGVTTIDEVIANCPEASVAASP